MGKFRYLVLGASALALGAATPALAAVNLVQNGGFETNGGNGQHRTSIRRRRTGRCPRRMAATSSCSTPAAAARAVRPPTMAAPSASMAPCRSGDRATARPMGSRSAPTAARFVAADPDFEDGAISQSLTGLTSGQTYAVSFWWAAGQQFGHSAGPPTAGWEVGLGSDPTQSTGNASIASHGFSGWTQTTFDFVAQGSTRDALVPRHWNGGRRIAALRAAGWRFGDLDGGAGAVDLGDDAPRLRRPRLRGVPQPPPHRDLDRLKRGVIGRDDKPPARGRLDRFEGS